MADYRFERECRTPYSEAYTVLDSGAIVGRIDLHFTPTTVEASLCVLDGFPADQLQDLIDAIDEELVLPAGVMRDDFVVNVFQGHSLGVFSDEVYEEETEEEEESESRNGNQP